MQIRNHICLPRGGGGWRCRLRRRDRLFGVGIYVSVEVTPGGPASCRPVMGGGGGGGGDGGKGG